MPGFFVPGGGVPPDLFTCEKLTDRRCVPRYLRFGPRTKPKWSKKMLSIELMLENLGASLGVLAFMGALAWLAYAPSGSRSLRG